jgi:5-formyltetrahydrofolate cyclo-ligase
MDKAELRARMRAIRDAIAPEERAARADAMQRRLLSLPGVAGAGGVLVFHAFGSEIPTRGVVAAFRARGATVLLPVVRDGRMHTAAWTEATELERAGPGFMQPAGGEPADPASIDLVVAPGLAFDMDGHRLGYGGGFYDRFLAALHRRALRVGVGYDEQLVDAIPHDDHDVPLHAVVTDARTVLVGT